MRFIGTFKIPTYAVNAIEYGDYTDLTAEDTTNIRDFLRREIGGERGYIVDWNTDNAEAYFSRCPAFGLPCAVVEADFYTD